MKILIVGASGFVGGHLIEIARARGHEVIGTQRSAQRNDLVHFDLVEQRLGETFDRGWFQSAVVIACAAIQQIDQCRQDPIASRRLNVEATERLLVDAAELGAQPVFISSSFVFSGTDASYRESAPRRPINAYGEQKAATEQFLEENLPNSLRVRFDKTVGDRPTEKHLFSEWYGWWHKRQPLRCIADQRFAPTLVDDAALGLLLACEQQLVGTYHIANPESFTRAELADLFLRHFGDPVPIICKTQAELGFLDLRPPCSVLDSSKLCAATEMKFTAMRETIERFRAAVEKHPL